jgi:hypothetical protein
MDWILDSRSRASFAVRSVSFSCASRVYDSSSFLIVLSDGAANLGPAHCAPGFLRLLRGRPLRRIELALELFDEVGRLVLGVFPAFELLDHLLQTGDLALESVCESGLLGERLEPILEVVPQLLPLARDRLPDEGFDLGTELPAVVRPARRRVARAVSFLGAYLFHPFRHPLPPPPSG